MIEIVSFYDALESHRTRPFEFLRKFADGSMGIILVNDMKWEKKGVTKHDITNKVKSIFSVTGVIVNESGKVEDLFRTYENYNRRVRSEFTNYEIMVSALPKNINFNESYKYFPIRIDFVER
jgi:hypothetical protein